MQGLAATCCLNKGVGSARHIHPGTYLTGNCLKNAIRKFVCLSYLVFQLSCTWTVRQVLPPQLGSLQHGALLSGGL